jgi:putative peptidoglycan lipid II flippase
MSIFRAIRARFSNAHPDHHAIARDMAWVSLFVLLGGTAHAAREMAIAYRYGVSEEVDAYLFLFNLIRWPVGVWFSVLTVVLVPLVARIRHGDSIDLPKFRSELLGLTIVVGIALTLLAWVGLPLLLHSGWTGLPSVTVSIASNMVPMLAFLAPLGVIISLFSAWMLADGRHTNTLLESVFPMVFLLGLFAFPSGLAEPLVWATLAGLAFHLISLAYSLVRRREVEAPCFTHQSAQWPLFWQGFGIMLLGQILMSFTVIVDQFFAAHLGTGAIAMLNYANRILALILGMGAMAVSRATMPVFSQSHAQGGVQLSRIAAHWARLLFVLGIVAAIVGWFLAPWGVKLLFERGAFTAQDTAVVAGVLRYGLTQLPFYFAGLVFVSYLSSRGLYVWLLWSGVIGLCSKLLGNAFFIPAYGIGGIAFATAFMYATNFFFFWWVFQKTIRTV